MSSAQMDEATRNLCYKLRHPGAGQKPMKFLDMIRIYKIKKKDGSTPKTQAISSIVSKFRDFKRKRGRKNGSLKTTPAENKKILQTFHKLRPPGHGIDSNALHRGLPAVLKKKIARRTVIRRLGDKGYFAQEKESKTDLGVSTTKKRLVFCKKHKDKTCEDWKQCLHAVGDMKEFTWYPRELQPKFKKLRSRWTFMTAKEKKKPAFQRPRRWFPKREYKLVKKYKVFGFTASDGKSLVFPVPSPWDADVWAVLVKKKLQPWLQKVFPGKTSFTILLDGEKLLRAPAAKRAYAAANITLLGPWPGYSPELNPQEHVWSRAEPELRLLENGRDSFKTWPKKVFKACRMYTGGHKLVGSMAKKVRDCLARDGAMLDC